MIPDITIDRSFQPYLSIARSSGYLAVQSTPIMGAEGSVVGILSTHFANTHQWSDAAQLALDQYSSQIGKLIEQLIESSVD
jgi:GAF domain-containing protein